MKKVLCSFGFSEHQKFLEVSVAGFYKYAQLHNYDVFLPNENFFSDETKQRPCSWWKIELIEKLFQTYDRILWIDADVVICKYNQDIFDDFSIDSHVGMVVHEVPIGLVPNCGIWLLDKKCLSWFHKLWPLNNLPRSDGWWEQDAMLHLLGIDSGSNDIKMPDTFDIPWTKLDYLWNPHVHDHRGIPKETKFFHATMFQDRLAIMKHVANQIGL
jgi:hypothetical protein